MTADRPATEPNYYDPGNFDGPSYNAGFTDGEMKGRAEAAQGAAPRHERGYIPLIDNRLRCKACEEPWPCDEAEQPGPEAADQMAAAMDGDWAAPRAEGLDGIMLNAIRYRWDNDYHGSPRSLLMADVGWLLARLSRPSDERVPE